MSAFNPLDFGAKGDGVADDSAAVWRAAGFRDGKYSIAPPGQPTAPDSDCTPRGSNIPRGRVIQFSPGTYRITRHLPLTSGLHYCGTRGSALLFADLPDNEKLFGIYKDRVAQCHNFSIQDLDAWSVPDKRTIFIGAIDSTMMCQCEIRDIMASNFFDVFEFGGMQDFYANRIERILVRHVGRSIYAHGRGGCNVLDGINLEGNDRELQAGMYDRPLIRMNSGANYIRNCLLEGIGGAAPIAYEIGGLGTSFNDNYLEYQQSGYVFGGDAPGRGSTVTANTMNMLGRPYKARVKKGTILTVLLVDVDGDDIANCFEVEKGARVHILTAIGIGTIKLAASLADRIKITQRLTKN